MNQYYKNIFIIILIVIILLQQCNYSNDVINKKDNKIIIPEKIKITDTVYVNKIITDTVYIKIRDIKEKIVVDKEMKIRYEKLKDSISRKSLFLRAIEVRSYNREFLNDDDINVSGNLTVRGELLDYNFRYKLKKKEIVYKPIYKRPNLIAGFGLETGIPTEEDSTITLKLEMSLENNKGHNYSVGFDTNHTLWLGYKKTFKVY